MFQKLFPVLFLLAIFFISCSGSSDPVSPDTADNVPDTNSQQHLKIPGTNRSLLGLWKISVSDDHQTVEVTPIRSADFHLNLTKLLDYSLCTDCIEVRDVIIPGPNQLILNVSIRHPLTDQKFTGFDVRGIFISGSDTNFPISGRDISWDGTYPRLQNAHGYTDLFNPIEYPQNGPLPDVYKYIRGRLALGGNLTSTVNPYMSYSYNLAEDRMMLYAGSGRQNWFHLLTPPGPFSFGYAIDASWVPTDGEVEDPATDIPLDADMREARSVAVVTGGNLGADPGSSTHVQVKIYDKQGVDTIESVTVEAPDLFAGVVTLDYAGPFEDSFTYTGRIQNDLGPAEGTYPLLVKVTDTEDDPVLGENAAWQVAPVFVKENWFRHWGYAEIMGMSWPNASILDNSDNSICIGTYGGGADLDPDTTDDNFDAADSVMKIVKFDSGGNFLWTNSWVEVTPTTYLYGPEPAVDSDNNILLTAIFIGTLDIDPGPSVDLRGTEEKYSSLLCKISPDGTILWTQVITPCITYDLTILNDGKIRITGSVTEPVDLDPGPGEHFVDPGYYSDSFICFFTPEGVFENAVTWGGETGNCGASVITDAPSGNIIVGGLFAYTADFDPGPEIYELTSGSYYDYYLASYSANGIFQWAINWGNTLSFAYSMWGFSDLLTDPQGNIYASGFWWDTIDFDPGPGTDFRTSTPSSSTYSKTLHDIFLVKYSQDGTYQWAYTDGTGGNDLFSSMDFDQSGNVLAGGIWNQWMVKADDATVFWLNDSYLARITPSGNLLWENSWGGYSTITNAQVGNSGHIYTHGMYWYSDVDPGQDTTIMGTFSSGDIYIQRLNLDGSF